MSFRGGALLRRRPFLWLFAGLLFVLLLTVLNSYIFLRSEGQRLKPVESLLFIMEMVTLTGTSNDKPVTTPSAQVWIIFLMMIGLCVVAGWHVAAHHWTIPMFERQPPVKAPRSLRGHVVIIGAGPIGRYVAEACQKGGQAHILLDRDQLRLHQATVTGLRGIAGDPHDGQTLQHARLAQARALVLTERDGLNIALLHQSQAHAATIPRYVIQEELPPALLKRAGATALVSAKRRLGERLGALALGPYTRGLQVLSLLLEGLSYLSLPILPGSPLAGRTISEVDLGRAAVRSQEGVVLLGVLSRGLFLPAIDEERQLHLGDLLIVAGRPEAVALLHHLSGARPFDPSGASGPVLILGAGHVGRAAAAYLKAQGAPVWLIDHQPLPPRWEVDRFTLGDATHAVDLRQAGAAKARCCIIALPDDEDAILAAMTVRGLNGGARILCRANAAHSLTALCLAGAETVVALPEVAGEALARLLLPTTVEPPALASLGVREVQVPERWIGRSLREFRRQTALVTVARRRTDGSVEFPPQAGAPLTAGESLILLGPVARLAELTGPQWPLR